MSTQKKKITFGKLTFSVDKAKGILSNLALITANREASGHGIYIDAKTLTTAKEVVGAQLKAYITHGSIDDYYENGFDRIMKVPGFFSQIDIKGDVLVAGQFEFYDAFRKHHEEEFDTLLEMAEKTPELFGLSIEAYGNLAYVAESGNEYDFYGPKVPADEKLKYGGMPALRVTELQAASFVSEPAANSGLFAKLSKALGTDKGTKLRKAVEDAIAKIESGNETTSVDLSDVNMIASIKAKFTDKALLSRALLMFAEDSKLTVEAIELKIKAEDDAAATAALQAELTTLRADKTRLETELKAANDKAASFETKFNALKDSGHNGRVDLGEGNGSEAAPYNPWKDGSVNLTKQAELEARDPEFAKVLKAAAGKK